MISVAIIEDDPVARVGISEIVSRENSMQVCLEVPNVEQFISRYVACTPDVTILDLHIRGSGIDGTRAVEALRSRGLSVLVLSVSDQETPVVDAIGAGANGYLTKESEPREIVRAIEQVANGRTYYSATVAGYLLRDSSRLTPRERDILRLVASGEKTRNVAEILRIKEKTVNGHLDRIRDKTGHRRRADLTRLAIERGLLSRPEKM